MNEKPSKWKVFTAGIIRENPVLRLVLGCCSALAVTTTVSGAVGMGLAMTFVLVCSNIVISALRKVIPAKVHLPCYIVIIATFVTVVQMVLQAFVPDLYKALGVYLALIVVNCIILGRAEMFACKNTVADSALDGLGMGIGSKTAKSDYTDKFLGQSLDTLSVDSITGATYSSKAVKTAVENALSAFEALQKEGK